MMVTMVASENGKKKRQAGAFGTEKEGNNEKKIKKEWPYVFYSH